MALRRKGNSLKTFSSQRGAGLVDAVITLFLLGVAGAVFSAMFPTGA